MAWMLLAALQTDYTIERISPTKLFDGQYSWCHPRAGSIPGANPVVVMTLQRIQLSGSDVFDKTGSGPAPRPGRILGEEA